MDLEIFFMGVLRIFEFLIGWGGEGGIFLVILLMFVNL